MEDDIKKFVNGRRPQKIWKWKMTSKDLKMEDNIKFFWKWKTTWKKFKMEDDQFFFENEDDLKSNQ